MFVATVLVSAVLAGLLFVSGAGKLARRQSQMATLAKVGFPQDKAWLLAAAEISGGLGLLAGLFWWPIGTAAAIGVVLYFVGAIAAHVRRRDWSVLPAAVLGLVACAALALRLWTR
jgi:uncharacterized membrane protein YphA (DoxX/SURF4 family)